MEDLPSNYYTIKTGFNRFCSNAVLRAAIPEIVQNATRASFEGSRLANLYVLQCLEDNPLTPDFGPLDQTFFYQVLCSISVGGHGAANQLAQFTPRQLQQFPHLALLRAVRDDYLQLRHPINAPQPPFASRAGNPQIFNRVARQYVTNCANNVAQNLEKRVKGYLSYKAVKYNVPPPDAPQQQQGAWNAIRSRQHLRTMVDFFYDHFFVLESWVLPTLPEFLADATRPDIQIFENLPIASMGPLNIFWNRWTTLFGKLFSHFSFLRTGGAFREPFKYWRECLPLLQRCLRAFERHHEDPAFEGIPGFRSFSLLPLYSAHRKYVTLDASALSEICASQGIPTGPANSPFSTLFDLRIVRLGAGGVGVANVIRQIKTDGIGVSVVVERFGLPKKRKQGPTLFAAQDDQLPSVPEMASPNCRVVGIDPGKRYMFYAAVQDGGAHGVETARGIRCSSREYREMAGFGSAGRRTQRWIEADPTVRDWAGDAPRRGHGTVDGLSERLEAELSKMDRLLTFYNQKRWAKTRWAGWMGKQRAMNQLVKRIRGNAANLVVGFGDGHFSPHIRGHPPAAVAGLKRALRRSGRVLDINEYRTSQVSTFTFLQYQILHHIQ